MAIYRLEAKVFSREKRGRSVVAAAAYRAGKKLKDELQDKTFDYARRTKGIIQSVILAPDGAASWAKDSGQLWNQVEKGEKRKDAQLAREFVLAVPRELDSSAQFRLAAEWAGKELVSQGMVAEITLHNPKKGNNPHVHILCTMRKLEGDNFSVKKSREWNEKAWLKHCRESWCDAENTALEKAGFSIRVDHRSLKDQGIDRKPEPKVGVAATAMERRGVVKDPRACQRRRAVQLWNATRPLVKALAAEYVAQTENVWNRSAAFARHFRDVAVKPFRDMWRSFMNSHSTTKTKDDPDRSR